MISIERYSRNQNAITIEENTLSNKILMIDFFNIEKEVIKIR